MPTYIREREIISEKLRELDLRIECQVFYYQLTAVLEMNFTFSRPASTTM